MLRKSFLTTIAAVTFSTALTPAFAGGTGDMGHRPAPVYHPAPVEPVVARSCEGPTLKEGQWTLTARAGIAPSSSNRKGHTKMTFIDATTGSIIGTHSHRTTLRNTSFTAGVDLGYVPMDNVETFFNFDFATSGSKNGHAYPAVNTPTGPIQGSIHYKQDNFYSYGFYLGSRYFFDLDCKFSPFIGAKLGVLNHQHGKHKIRVRITQNNNELLNVRYQTHHNKNSTRFSGGFQLGADYCVSDPVSLFIMAEAIGTTKSNKRKHETHTFKDIYGNRLHSKSTHATKGTFSFPITAGIKVRL